MSIETAESASLRAAIATHRDALDTILERYHAANPRVFGSVARGDATSESDIDLLVDLTPGGGNELLRVAGIAEELSGLLGTDRKSTRLNSSHANISYAVFCLKKKKHTKYLTTR